MELTQRDFQRLSLFIYQKLGIKISDSKRTMLQGRLGKRLRALKLSCVEDYCEYLFSPQGEQMEHVHLFDVVTTNKTDFFRESGHFDYLTSQVLSSWQAGHRHGRRFRIWSAGCSTGEEPYTMAMVLNDYAQQHPGFDFEIIATDISTRVLDHARTAVYHKERIAPVAEQLRKRYLLKHKDSGNELVRISPDLRKKVRFGRLNFMDSTFQLPDKVDVIFCRNVIIYFDKTTQEKLVGKFCHHLKDDGFLFLGHSESLHGFSVPLHQVAPTVYRLI
ncbi:protein-glutamate O-methyltransferase CheR [Desulfuromonas acetoxidans]|uniref:protein-glutamate O-methyltransferase n=1 Tax=Desulfuromonas acetoxidans (strain DSM 684 / 11070) TaxID=281689 RepID=Q1JXR6_DESA6|nr:protein-glutamate O-methyltransferase [Desulfuromonas acetoxidans]EAT15077.1 MCP methyltransferase, CheR-type [Desulfuromonas acetoxidans DSM 684]MBF0646448.1 protein-glutamate O-methyltransferase [Desulfuromonas acetoxidans]NVD25003.1 protein-glutamate O-methyltransferase [Desulfuromonas acetoxidans]NVE15304.1 protein-glutamate O-methyltransferase [Desulfuromonas acetoxidans]